MNTVFLLFVVFTIGGGPLKGNDIETILNAYPTSHACYHAKEALERQYDNQMACVEVVNPNHTKVSKIIKEHHK